MPAYEFSLSLSPDEVLSIYEGRTRFVLVTTQEGLRLQLPATNFRQFVTPTGVSGRFVVTIDANNKLTSLHLR